MMRVMMSWLVALATVGCGGTTGLDWMSSVDSGPPGIVACLQHTCAWATDGTVWCWGLNASGELGDGTTVERHAPVRIIQIPDHDGIATYGCGYAWSTDGTIWYLTTNGPEILFEDDALRGIAAWYPSILWLENGRAAMLWRSFNPDTLEILWAPELHDVVAGIDMDPSARRPLVAVADGSVWSLEIQGPPAHPATLSSEPVPWLDHVAGMAGGPSHSCVWHHDGTASCWGSNDLGQLGDGTRQDRDVPVQVVGLERVAGMTAGSQHSCAWLEDGSAWCWGGNGYGRLGDGTQVDRLTPRQVHGLEGVVSLSSTRSHTCALLRDSTMWCWGWNRHGQLGDGTTEDRFVPVQVVLP